MPNFRKLSISVILSSLHMPKDLILNSMFSLTESLSITSIPLRPANRGQYLTFGSVTSTTLPSSMVTRLIPRHSMTCLDMKQGMASDVYAECWMCGNGLGEGCTRHPRRNHSMTSTLMILTSLRGLSFLSVSTRPMTSTTGIPSMTVPKTGWA